MAYAFCWLFISLVWFFGQMQIFPKSRIRQGLTVYWRIFLFRNLIFFSVCFSSSWVISTCRTSKWSPWNRSRYFKWVSKLWNWFLPISYQQTSWKIWSQIAMYRGSHLCQWYTNLAFRTSCSFCLFNNGQLWIGCGRHICGHGKFI